MSGPTSTAACVAALALLCAGCAGSKGSGRATDTSAADRGLAGRLVLQRRDFPRGWRVTEVTASTTAQSQAAAKTIAACTGRPDPKTFITADVSGPDGSRNGVQVGSSATIVRTAADGRADFRALTGSRGIGCFRSYMIGPLVAAARKQHAKVRATITRLKTKTYGEATSFVRLTLVVIQGRARSTTFLDLVLMMKGRYEVTGSFLAPARPFDAKQEAAFLAALGAKLKAA